MTDAMQFAVWGASGVGKTMYLAGAMLEIFARETGWTWVMAGADAEQQRTYDFINSEMGKLLNGAVPEPTDAGQAPEQYVFHLEQEYDWLGKRGRNFHLTLVDVAGIHIEDVNDTQRYFETLCNSDGVLMMIDPGLKATYLAATAEGAEVTYFALLNLIISHLQAKHVQGAKLKIPVAICLTKMDENEHWPHRGDPKKYLKDLFGKETFGRLDRTFADKEYFSVSVVGRYIDPVTGREGPNLNPDGDHLLKRERDAHCVLTPLLWLMHRYERTHSGALSGWRHGLRTIVREPIFKPCQQQTRNV